MIWSASSQTSSDLMSAAKRFVGRLLWKGKCLAAQVYVRRYRRKSVSAMIRVKNEEEFLYAAVKSIADYVDEIVLVDNLSTDRTPSIIEALREEYPHKVASYHYPFPLLKRGRENWEAAARPTLRSSPSFSSNYYNWCLRKCTKPYILKWDGDMIATDPFVRTVEEWRVARHAVLFFKGANVHPDRQHLIAAKSSDPETLRARLAVPVLPGWIATMTYAPPEPRLFPRFLARYDMGHGWTERLSSPLIRWRQPYGLSHHVKDVCFLHLKYCKRNPYVDFSSDLKGVISSNIAVGPPLYPEWHAVLRHWKIDRAGLVPPV